MLSPDEFFSGYTGNTKPLSLILPIRNYDAPILIGKVDNDPIGVILGGSNKSTYFKCEESSLLGGLIIPDVRVEVDETSIFDAGRIDPPALSVVRMDRVLSIVAKAYSNLHSWENVVLHDDLPKARDYTAGFKAWQVVLGNGSEKRVLWKSSDDAQT